MSGRVVLPGLDLHLGGLSMMPQRRWSAVASRLPLRPMPDPHGASAMAELDGLRACSSLLPWRSCDTQDPWAVATTAEKTIAAVAAVEAAVPTVWGGDWNHALSGREWTGSVAGRRSMLESVERGLQVPTAVSPHQIEDLLSIDHIAVPKSWGYQRDATASSLRRREPDLRPRRVRGSKPPVLTPMTRITGTSRATRASTPRSGRCSTRCQGMSMPARSR
jgi:hypothetical protein